MRFNRELQCLHSHTFQLPFFDSTMKRYYLYDCHVVFAVQWNKPRFMGFFLFRMRKLRASITYHTIFKFGYVVTKIDKIHPQDFRRTISNTIAPTNGTYVVG